MRKNKKILSFFALLAIGAGTLPFSNFSTREHAVVENFNKNLSILKESNSDLNNLQNLGVSKLTAFQQNLSYLSFLSDSSFKRQASDSLFDEYLQNRENEILDKTAAVINTFGVKSGWSNDKIKEQITKKCGLLIKKFSDYKNELKSDQDSSQDGVANGERLLSFLNDESTNMGIDMFDSYQASLTIQGIESNYLNSLMCSKNLLLSTNEKLSLSQKFCSVLDKFLEFAKLNFYTQTNFDWSLIEIQKQQSFFNLFYAPLNSSYDNAYCSYTTYSDNIAYQQLGLILNEFISYFDRNLIQVREQGVNFIQHISDYSPSGTINLYNETTSQMIDNDYLTDLFNFHYDETYGMDLELPTDIDYSQPADDSSASLFDDIGLYSILPIQEHTTLSGVTYKNGELLPGYTAVFRIVNSDLVFDDSSCEVKIELGIYDTVRDPKKENILWASDYYKQKNNNALSSNVIKSLNSYHNDVSSAFYSYKLHVESIEQKRYIAKNCFGYYKDWVFSNKKDDKDYNSKIDEWYNSTASQRTHIDEILDNNCEINENGEYILDDEHPIYLSGADVVGIPLPQKYEDYGFEEVGKTLVHSNQKLVLKAIDYSTDFELTDIHNLSLKVCWSVITSSDSSLSSNSSSDNLDKSVYDIPWSRNNNSDEEQYRWISFTINEDLLSALGYASSFISFLYNYIANQEPILLQLDTPVDDSNGDVTYLDHAKEADTWFKVDLGVFSFNGAVAILGIAYGIVLSLNIATYAIGIKTAIAYAFALAVSILAIVFTSIMYVSYDQSYQTTKKVIPVAEKYHSYVRSIAKDVKADYSSFMNPKLNFNAKKAALSNAMAIFGLEEDSDGGWKIYDQEKADQALQFHEDYLKSISHLTDKEWENMKNNYICNFSNAGDFNMSKMYWKFIMAVDFAIVANAVLCFIASCVGASEIASQAAQTAQQNAEQATQTAETAANQGTNISSTDTQTLQPETQNTPQATTGEQEFFEEEQEEHSIHNDLYEESQAEKDAKQEKYWRNTESDSDRSILDTNGGVTTPWAHLTLGISPVFGFIVACLTAIGAAIGFIDTFYQMFANF